MNDLIEALQIFKKYACEDYPTHCSHDQLAIMGITKDMVTTEDHERLEELGFYWSPKTFDGVYISFRFGSA